MRLNVTKYRQLINKRGIEISDIERMTGITVMTLEWIFENEYLEISTLERLAQVVECDTREIALQDNDSIENAIEWLKDKKTATVSLTQGRTISRIKKFSQSHPDECKIIAENKDGSICARIPVSWVKLTPPRSVTEVQKEAARQNMKDLRARNLL